MILDYFESEPKEIRKKEKQSELLTTPKIMARRGEGPYIDNLMLRPSSMLWGKAVMLGSP